MALLYDWGFHLLPGRREDFLAWLADNEPRMEELAPSNYHYLGTYRALGPDPVDFHQLWRYGGERPPDMRVAAEGSAGSFTDLAREYLSFVDLSRTDEETFLLYTDAVPHQP
jgi:hypothetical protein